MGKVRVNIVEPDGSSALALLPDDVPVSRLAKKMADELYGRKSTPFDWKFIDSDGNDIDSDRTLAQAGVGDGHEIRLGHGTWVSSLPFSMEVSYPTGRQVQAVSTRIEHLARHIDENERRGVKKIREEIGEIRRGIVIPGTSRDMVPSDRQLQELNSRLDELARRIDENERRGIDTIREEIGEIKEEIVSSRASGEEPPSNRQLQDVSKKLDEFAGRLIENERQVVDTIREEIGKLREGITSSRVSGEEHPFNPQLQEVNERLDEFVRRLLENERQSIETIREEIGKIQEGIDPLMIRVIHLEEDMEPIVMVRAERLSYIEECRADEKKWFSISCALFSAVLGISINWATSHSPEITPASVAMISAFLLLGLVTYGSSRQYKARADERKKSILEGNRNESNGR